MKVKKIIFCGKEEENPGICIEAYLLTRDRLQMSFDQVGFSAYAHRGKPTGHLTVQGLACTFELEFEDFEDLRSTVRSLRFNQEEADERKANEAYKGITEMINKKSISQEMG